MADRWPEDPNAPVIYRHVYPSHCWVIDSLPPDDLDTSIADRDSLLLVARDLDTLADELRASPARP